MKKGNYVHYHCSFSSSTSEEDEIQEQTEDCQDPGVMNEDVNGVAQLPKTTQVVFEIHSGRPVPRLCEPRHLYGVSGHLSQTLSRWPKECEVIPEEIHHIDWTSPSPEPFCIPESEKWPRYQNVGGGTLVYNSQAGKELYFTGSRPGGNRSPLSQASIPLSGPDDTTLLFEGRFECANLMSAHRIGQFDYDLMLRPDLYTKKHTQWFYFRVRNMRAGVPYRFTITNLLKATSLYEKGQKPLLYSEEKARAFGVGWHRVGYDVSYSRNECFYLGLPCFSLSWSLVFPYDQDTCYLAHCYPYTYTKLWAYLSKIEHSPRLSSFCKIRTLCRSLAGNLVPVLTVTSPSRKCGECEAAHKPAIVITARVHPGETNSSWVMKGIMDFLLSDTPDARLLRDAFIFKLVPMLNPDGVIVGNYRCSLTGSDLNRSYNSNLKDSFPTVHAVRTMVHRLCEEREVLLYCDLHGHSRKQNVFTYGCERAAGRQLHERIFPLMLSKNCPEMFSFQNCKFKVQRSKEGTGRIALWKLGILNSFTLETSFCGSSIGQQKGTHFSIKDLEMLGAHFCDTLLDYCDPDRTKYNMCIRELQDSLRQETTLTLAEAPHSDNVSTSGSNSSDSDGPPAHLEALQMINRKKSMKSKKQRDCSCLLRYKEKTPEENKHMLRRGKQEAPLESADASRKMSVLYLVFDNEKGSVKSKSDYLRHLMAGYIRSRMQMGLSNTLSGLDLGPITMPSGAPRKANQLSGLGHLACGDKRIWRLSPVQWRGSKSHPAPFTLPGMTNRQGEYRTAECKRGQWHGVVKDQATSPDRKSEHVIGKP
ncbi:cytosolic carboxypeptidase 2-like isoform X3 [Alosa alosa]|uniref:cytosolic carboxypeptidase 2-like isoform X3 n=1 Tax=Alosa alosa TaxID=278164 RepID=UPI00201537E7|nr:cytosolic carboxypeptidase 2-like isoform X3 [Alosa alosa]